MKINQNIFKEMFNEFDNNLLKLWYMLAIDKECGGYYSNISYDWQIEEKQDKMIVTQARHIWLLSKAADIFEDDNYKQMAEHGFYFLKNYMWDSKFGGFYQIRSRDGSLSETENWFDEKRVYGNAFAIYGLAALYKTTQNSEVLDLAKETFYWIENNAYDPIDKGYFQFFTREGESFGENSKYKTTATDFKEAGLKDQNSSIHLLEAFTELYSIWPNQLLKERLTELLFLIRDIITTEEGYLTLFFTKDWNPISFKLSSKAEREDNYGLDHVSFGHDYETAFLMLEASHVLGIENDIKTLTICKKMLDHAIKFGWDDKNGGFFDEGYYFDGEEKCKIIKDTKTWWPQAEGLNALLLFGTIFSKKNNYNELFEKLWEYVKEYLLDDENKGWYWGSIEKEPFMKSEPKGSIWKAAYHDGRSLMNCLSMLADSNFEENIKQGFISKVVDTNKLIQHWQIIAEKNNLL